jgi:autotransporter-associated beta strand protein
MSDNPDEKRALDAVAGGISFIGDGWNQHQLGTDEGAGVWLRGLATYANPDGSVTVFIAGSQGNMFSATVPASGTSGIPSFSPVSHAGSPGTVPAFKWFDGVSFGGAQPGTLGFATGYHGLVLQTIDGGQTWTDLTDPTSSAELQADVTDIGISPGATVDGNGTTPELVATSLAPDASFYPPVHYGTIGPNGTITWAASALSYDNGTTTVPLDPTYYDRILQAVYLSDNLVLTSGNVATTTPNTGIYPLMLSTDGGIDFSTIPTFPQGSIRQLHEIVVDPTHQGIVWGAATDGIIVRADLSSYFGAGPPAVTFSEIQTPATESLYGVAISPDDDTIVAITQHGTVYWATDPAGINSNDGASLQWNTAGTTLTIGEVWSAQFITDSTVVVIGQADSHVVNGNTVETTGAAEMVWVSTDAGQDWVPDILSQWSTQQTALTGVIDAFTSGGTNHLENSLGEIAISQDTLLLSGATIEVTSTAAVTTAAMIILPPGPASSAPALSVDTQGNDLTLNSVLSGSGGLVKTGAGTLTLKPVPSYNPDGTPDFTYQANFQSGGVEIDGGAVAIDLDAELGVPNANEPGHSSDEAIYPNTGDYALTLDGGTLLAGQDIVLQTIYDGGDLVRPVVLGASGGALDPNGFTMTLPGPITGTGGLTEQGTGTLVLEAINNFGGGITVQSGTLTLQLSGALPSDTVLSVAASGTVRLDGSAQTANAVTGANGGEIALNGGVLVIDDTAQGPDIDFGGRSGDLLFAASDPSVLTSGLTSTIVGFNPAAETGLTGLAYSADDALNYSDGTLTIDNNGSALAVLHFDPAGSYDFALAPGVHDTLVLTDLACFCEGTLIATRRGDVPVECLRVGDLAITADGSELPVVWVGYRHVACSRHPRPELVWPVRVRAHSFGNGRPRRDLWLSADHAVFAAGVLIPIKYLINGTSIAQIAVDQVTYHHVELAHHNVLLAEGLPAESYLPTGDRSNFSNGGPDIRLFPDFATPSWHAPAVWEAYGYAPLIVTGPALDAVRRLVAASAALQFSPRASSQSNILLPSSRG